MLAWRGSIALLVFASSFLRAQLTIENPKHVEVPEQQAQALFLVTQRVMESEFHSPGSLENRFRMRLVLGQAPEHFTVDDAQGNGTLFLEKWDDGKFAVAAMRLAVQHLLGPERQQKMLQEIRKRTSEVAPVPVSKLHGQPMPSASPSNPAWAIPDKCMDQMTNAALRVTACQSSPVGLSKQFMQTH
jgi:hypothetical protein